VPRPERMQLIQIVPGFPPKVDGIGDYALQLARRLRRDQSIETTFLVADPDWQGGNHDAFPVCRLGSRTPEALLEAIIELEAKAGTSSLPILAQFSVYGYEKRGCPFWFIDGLDELRQKRHNALCVAFHELENSSSKPWSSVFWLTRIQRGLIKRLAHMADYSYTNTDVYRRKLESWGATNTELIPNFSTLGEVRNYPPFDRRHMDMIVFGRPAQRLWTYERGGHVLGPLCRLMGVERILDIGQPLRHAALETIDGIPVVRLGLLSEQEVGARMSTSVGSFMEYPISLLTKSSVHAASCSFGLIPFVFHKRENARSCPPLVEGEDFIPVTPDVRGIKLPSLENLSRKVFDNYQRRSSREAARAIAQQLTSLE